MTLPASIEHLDLITPCLAGETIGFPDRPTGPCPLPAAGDLACRVCGAATTVCVEHRQAVVRSAAATCVSCRAEGRPSRLFAYRRVRTPR